MNSTETRAANLTHNLALQTAQGADCPAWVQTSTEGDMKMLPAIFATAALLASANAQAAFLNIVNVTAPDINCVFEATCKVVVNDSIGDLSFTPLGNGARLQTRTFKSAIASPAAGKIAYLYRVDLTNAVGFTDCLAGLVLDFGPVPKLPFTKNLLSHVYVITKGGIGSVGVKSA
jgi:hypothetical protein